MTDKKTISVSTDPEFIKELSEYLEVLSNPARLGILKLIEREPKEISEIAEHTGMTYQNTKKHLDRLINTSLVKRAAGFGRETERGIAPVWKYSLAEGAMETLVKTLGIFSSIAVPMGYNDIRERIRSVRSAVLNKQGKNNPVLFLISGKAEGSAFILKTDWIALGRSDPDESPPESDHAVILSDDYRAVTRITKPHAMITRSENLWQIEDAGSSGGTYLNTHSLEPGKKADLVHGDVIDLSIGTHSARFLFITTD